MYNLLGPAIAYAFYSHVHGSCTFVCENPSALRQMRPPPFCCNVSSLVALWISFSYLAVCSGRPCAAGKLYSPENDTIAGLQPAHFVTMATPHLGVAGQGDYKVSTCAQAFVMLA